MLFGLYLALALFSVQAGEKKSAHVECATTEDRLVYECMITLTGKKSGQLISNAEFTVGADMPSMAMAHNVVPVPAHNHGNGMYHVRIALEMYGEWALKLEFTKPHRDLVVTKLVFGKESVTIQDGHSNKHEHKKKQED
jgi:hypothetical protein